MALNKAARSIVKTIAVPNKRETMTIQSNGKLFDVDKERWMKEFRRARGLGINPFGRE